MVLRISKSLGSHYSSVRAMNLPNGSIRRDGLVAGNLSRFLSSSKPTNKNAQGEWDLSLRIQNGLKRFLEHKEMPERYTFAWYREITLICTVFAITGSTTMLIVRPAVKDILGIRGSFRDGPWSYRIASLVIMTPIYAVLLVAVGTVFGRHAYFRYFSVKIFSRFGIPPESLDQSYHETKKTFRKW